MSPAKFLKNEIIYNGHLQSIGAAGIFYISVKFLFNLQPMLAVVFAYYLLFEVIFIFDRYRDLGWDSLTNSERSRHLLLYRDKIKYIFFIFLISSLSILYLYTSPLLTTAMAAILVFGLLYPIYFKKLTKVIPLFKNVYVSGVYALLPLTPGLYLTANQGNSVNTLYLVFIIFVESLIAQIILDTKDTDSDRKAGLKTVPVLVGNDKTLKLAILLSVGVVLLSIISHMSAVLLIFVVTSFAIDACVANLLKNKNMYGYLLAAAKLPVWFVVFLLFQILL